MFKIVSNECKFWKIWDLEDFWALFDATAFFGFILPANDAKKQHLLSKGSYVEGGREEGWEDCLVGQSNRQSERAGRGTFLLMAVHESWRYEGARKGVDYL